jgi:DNA-binding CsgD family transcriptional regulator/PAS domain-containing protein
MTSEAAPVDPAVLGARLVDDVYALATQLDGLTKLTESLARATRSRSCGLMIQDRRDYSVRGGWFWGIDWEWGLAYQQTYYACDPTVVEHFGIPSGRAYASRFDRDSAEFRATRFYAGWCAPQKLGYFAGAYLDLEDHVALRLTFQGDDTRGAYEPEVLALVESLLPHIRRAVDINRRITQLVGHAHAFSRVLEQSQNAIILLDVTGAVVYHNEAAGKLSKSGVTLDSGAIRIDDAHARKQFALALAGCVANLKASIEAQVHSGTHVPLARGGLLPLSLYLSPVRLQGASPNDPLPADLVMLQLIDPETQLQLDAERLREVMALTPAEARVAARLCHGDSAADVAGMLSLSPHTVRDHVKHIYAKVGVAKQSEFVARAYSVLRLQTAAPARR